MAWSFAQECENISYPSSSSGQSATFGSPCTLGWLIFIYLQGSNSTPPTWNDGVNTYKKLAGPTFSSNLNNWVSFYYAINTSSSPLTVSWSGPTYSFPAFQCAEFTPGSGSTISLDQSSSFVNTSGSTGSISVGSTGANELIVGGVIFTGGAGSQASAGWNNFNGSGSTYSPSIYNIGTSAGTYNASWTFTENVNYAGYAFSWISTPPAPPPSGNPANFLLLGCG